MAEKKPVTHNAYAQKREGRTAFRWLEIGTARIESDGTGTHNVYLDRMPIGGFTGRIHLSPVGIMPVVPDAQPQHPDQATEDEGH